MNAITVCVDMSDLLSITLPYNRHHFGKVMVVTTPDDIATQSVAYENKCSVLRTRSFYQDGKAEFAKYAALEEGLTALGRDGWICIMDCDILMPKTWWHSNLYEGKTWEERLTIGNLYTPLRRMCNDPTVYTSLTNINEAYWQNYPLHPQQQEFAGYMQIFHASDPHLLPPPWHDTRWKHAGGGDSFFQALWPTECKVRPMFQVLHLGPSGVNWCGRTTPYLDGTVPPEVDERRKRLQQYLRGRIGRAGDERFRHEKLP